MPDDVVVLKVPVQRSLLAELEKGVDCAHLRWVRVNEHEDALWISKGAREEQVERGAERLLAGSWTRDRAEAHVMAKAVLLAALDSHPLDGQEVQG